MRVRGERRGEGNDRLWGGQGGRQASWQASAGRQVGESLAGGRMVFLPAGIQYTTVGMGKVEPLPLAPPGITDQAMHTTAFQNEGRISN